MQSGSCHFWEQILWCWSDSFKKLRLDGCSQNSRELVASERWYSWASSHMERRVPGAWLAVAGPRVAKLEAGLKLPASCACWHRSKLVKLVEHSGVLISRRQGPCRHDVSCACGRLQSRQFWRLGRRRGEKDMPRVLRYSLPNLSGLHQEIKRRWEKITVHSTQISPHFSTDLALPSLLVRHLPGASTQLSVPEGSRPESPVTGVQRCFDCCSAWFGI